ncbi:MAG: hypothetical protein B6I24_01730 [Bacteroidetes bacterium 4572_128]|nr:MAG: hypothetical protein B6I24_01730 [Bacteroidetes bacterium 4572_128]
MNEKILYILGIKKFTNLISKIFFIIIKIKLLNNIKIIYEYNYKNIECNKYYYCKFMDNYFS